MARYPSSERDFPASPSSLHLVNHRIIRGPLRHRAQRALFSAFLAWMQISLLWVAASHRHAETENLLRTPATLQQADRQPQPPLEGWLICAVCQYVRHSAGKPASGTPTVTMGAGGLLSPEVVSLDIPFFHPTVQHSRAPPVS